MIALSLIYDLSFCAQHLLSFLFVMCPLEEIGQGALREVILTRWADVNVNISDDILNGVDDLLEDESFAEFCLEHFQIICVD